MRGRLAMLLQKLLRYMLSECPNCHKPLGFEPWETSTACDCGTYIWLRPQTDNQPVPMFVTVGQVKRPIGPSR